MCSPCSSHVAVHGVGRQVVDVSVPTGRQNHRVGGVRIDFACEKVSGDDSGGASFMYHDIEHLGTCVHLDVAESNLARQRLVGPEQ